MKKFVHLNVISHLQERLKSGIPHIQVILGPRQVGKTTTILHFLAHEYGGKSHFVSADQVFQGSVSWLKENWQEARRLNALLVVDEIQKIENWAEVVKSLYDEDKRNGHPIRCVLLGSSSLDIQKGLTESLTGRFNLIRAHHWNYRESKEGYDLSFDSFLKYGGYPGSYPLLKKEQEWVNFVKHSIVETVIEKDILQNHTVKSPALFKQAFEMLMAYPAQEISYTKLLGQLQDKGNTEVIKYYLRLYEGAFLVRVLEKFSKKVVKLRSSSPKILPLAPALYFLTVQDEYTAEEKGRVFELLVGAQLVRTGLNLYYWREKNDEVDYVVKKGRKLWAIEVKSGRRKNSKGLDRFKEQFPEAQLLIITPENYFQFEEDPNQFLEQAITPGRA